MKITKTEVKKYTKILAVGLVAASSSLSAVYAGQCQNSDADWKESTISPVANPLFFESPFIQSELRPLFVQHNISDDFIGGYAQVYALQVRWAVNDRLAIIATKDGYVRLRPDVSSLRDEGWADVAVGLKYALVDDKENQLILTPGVKFEFPWGCDEVFQGNGCGEFDLFVSAAKGWDKFHATASTGVRLPVDFNAETASLHYSLQLDYYACRWFIPFATLNGFTVLSETDNGPAFGIEGFDLINFGASDAKGYTEVAAGVGFRSRLTENLDFGFAYEKAVADGDGIFDDRFTVDMILHF